MAQSFRQLANRRKTRGITQPALASRMGCSVPWIKQLEQRREPDTIVAAQWRDRYEEALQELIEERQVLLKAGGKCATG